MIALANVAQSTILAQDRLVELRRFVPVVLLFVELGLTFELCKLGIQRGTPTRSDETGHPDDHRRDAPSPHASRRGVQVSPPPNGPKLAYYNEMSIKGAHSPVKQ